MYGNQTTLGESDDALTAKIALPDGSESQPLKLSQQVLANGTTKYELRTDATFQGTHLVHVLLRGVPIKGSPVAFDVVSAHPETQHSKLVHPGIDPCIASNETPTVVSLVTYDRFSNACARGGLLVTGRLQLVKHSAESNVLLMPNNHSVTVDDHGDGTYAIKILIKMTATVKLYVQMDKNLGAAGELPPLTLNFVDQAGYANAPNAAPQAAPQTSPQPAPPASPSTSHQAASAKLERTLTQDRLPAKLEKALTQERLRLSDTAPAAPS